jgi:hypothetical protein
MAWKSGECRFLPSCDDEELAYIMTGANRAYDLARMKRFAVAIDKSTQGRIKPEL